MLLIERKAARSSTISCKLGANRGGARPYTRDSVCSRGLNRERGQPARIRFHQRKRDREASPIVQSRNSSCRILTLSGRSLAAIVLVLVIVAAPLFGSDKNLTLKIPPVQVPLHIKDQQITIVASGLITIAPKAHGVNNLGVELTADLADVQQNWRALLSAELDKDARCGDRIQIEDATLTPAEPASVAIVHLHYERWGCAKLLGKQEAKKLIGGNAVIQLKLAPSVAENHSELRLAAELGPIEADGSLGELLHAGNLGELLRDQIQTAILSAMQKGLDLGAILPPGLQGSVTIQDARFRDAGSGRLIVTLDGQVQMTDEQLATLAKQLKNRLPLHGSAGRLPWHADPPRWPV
jgi:hypothetical protein